MRLYSVADDTLAPPAVADKNLSVLFPPEKELIGKQLRALTLIRRP